MTSGRLIPFASGNKAVIHRVLPKERVAEIGDYVRGRVSAGDAPAPPASPSTGAPEERFRRLEGMLDGGLISQLSPRA